MKIKTKIYDISSNLNKTITLISDIHYKDKFDIKKLNNVLHNIKKIKPDFICITGDITDNYKLLDEDIYISWYKKLAGIAKVIICLGNHEFYFKQNKKIYKLNTKFLEKLTKINNLYLLDNKNYKFDNINFIGITLPIKYYHNEEKNKDKVIDYVCNNIKKEDGYNILLIHSPINITNEKLIKKIGVDLILCGHMHGGVVLDLFRPIFKNNGLIAPRKKLFPKNAYGNICIDNTNIIITSGLKVLPYKYLNKLFEIEIVKINL